MSWSLEKQNEGVRYEAAGLGRSFVMLCRLSSNCRLFPMATGKPVQSVKQRHEGFVEGIKDCFSYRYGHYTKQCKETGTFDDSIQLS